jgi:Cu2+-exporting ATPase
LKANLRKLKLLGEFMEEQHQHRAEPRGFNPGWVFLPGLALVVGLIFALTLTVMNLIGSPNIDLGFWWAFVWLIPVLVAGRYAVIFLERRLNFEATLATELAYVKQAQKVRPKFELAVEKVTTWAVLGVVAIGILAAVLGWWLGGLTPQAAIERFMATMLIAAPQALWLALPSVSRLATAIAAFNGIYYSNRAQFDALGSVDMVLFDKTGTLTTAERRFVGAHLTHGSPLSSTDELLAIAAGVEAHSDHPIAVAIFEEAKNRDIEPLEVRDFRLIPGQGGAGTHEAQTIVVGGPIILTSRNMTLYVGDLVKCDAANHAGHTVLFVIRDAELLGWLELGDHIRGSSKSAVQALQYERKRIGLLTGDAQGVATWVGNDLGITETFAEVLPHQKADVVSRLQADTSKIAMVGDGVNDAQALAQADVGVAFGVGDSQPVESAGITIASTDPVLFARALILSKRAAKKARQNLIWSLVFTSVTLPLAAGALAGVGFSMSPAVAAGLSLALSALVLANTRSLRRG